MGDVTVACFIKADVNLGLILRRRGHVFHVEAKELVLEHPFSLDFVFLGVSPNFSRQVPMACELVEKLILERGAIVCFFIRAKSGSKRCGKKREREKNSFHLGSDV